MSVDLLALATETARAAINTRIHDGRPSRVTGHPPGVGYCRPCAELAAVVAPAMVAVLGPAVLDLAAHRWADEPRDRVPWSDVVVWLDTMADELRRSSPTDVEEVPS